MDSARIDEARTGIALEYARNQEERTADFPQLPNLPAGRYSDPEFYQLEIDHMWNKTWLLVGHTGELPEKGSYKVWNELKWPVILVRGADDQIRAFHNVCRHRGGAFVAEPKGKMKVFSCHFHGWTYGLDGKFKGMPVPFDFPDFKEEENGLLPLRCETLGPLIFINRDLNAPSLLQSFGPRIVEDIKDYDFDKRVIFHKGEYNLLTNWKYVHEAFLEEYPIYTVHAKTFASAVKPGSTLLSIFDNGNSRIVSSMRDDDPTLKAANPMYNARGGDPRHQLNRESFIAYGIHPNITFSFSENEFTIFVMWPRGPLETYSEIYFLTIPENGVINQARCDRFLKEFPLIMDEDIENCRRAAAGLNGGALNEVGFNMGCGDRQVYHWHEAIDRTMGIERIPEKLRVRQMLQPYHEH